MKTCEICRRDLEKKQFYFSQRKRLRVCKSCANQGFDAEDKHTYLWILRELDMPFLPKIWNTTRAEVEKNGNDPKRILGKYIAKMHLAAFRLLTWEDSDKEVI